MPQVNKATNEQLENIARQFNAKPKTAEYPKSDFLDALTRGTEKLNKTIAQSL